MADANETIGDIVQVSLYEGEAELPDDFASEGPCEGLVGAVDAGVFVRTGGRGGDRVDAAIQEACPVREGDGGHFLEGGYVVVEITLEARYCK